MSWAGWADALRRDPEQAVGDLLSGAADVGMFERAAPHEFLLAVLPRDSRLRSGRLLGEPHTIAAQPEPGADLPCHVDAGLAAWLHTQRASARPSARKLGAYAAQVCEALQWPLYFPLPKTRAALGAERPGWLHWLRSLTLSAFRDPEYDYWQVLATRQVDDGLQAFWHGCVTEAGRTRSLRYLDLGLLALAQLPLSDDDSLRNLRLQVQALVNRYQSRRTWGTAAHQEMAEHLRGVMARNPSLSAVNYQAFLTELLKPLGQDKTVSLLSLLGLQNPRSLHRAAVVPAAAYQLDPPGRSAETDEAVRAVRNAASLDQAWDAIRPLLSAHEDYVHRSSDAYHFVRALDMCARALCKRYRIPAGPIQDRLFQWIQLALQMDGDNPRLWMLWQLALRQSDQPARAQWVLWEMTRRFPDHLPCRVDLARLLATSGEPDERVAAKRLLEQVLGLDPKHLHAYSTLAQLAIRAEDWDKALGYAQRGLQIDPSHEPSAVLLATAYARRGAPGDLDAAIEHLQGFTSRYRGQLKAEDYLRKLQQRQQSRRPSELPELDHTAPSSITADIAAEPDPAWRAFAESLRTWTVGADAAVLAQGDAASIDRLLPLPAALRQAAARGQWDADLLGQYDAAVRQEFPLEIRVWRYLQTLHSDRASAADRARARQEVESWMEQERKAPSAASDSWIPFLTQSWASVSASVEAALPVGADWLADWLKALLDRYQPLPPPLFA